MKNVTWREIKDWWPILLAVVAITSAFFSVSVRLAVVEQGITDIKEAQAQILNKYVSVEGRYGNLALKVQAAETNINNLEKFIK